MNAKPFACIGRFRTSELSEPLLSTRCSSVNWKFCGMLPVRNLIHLALIESRDDLQEAGPLGDLSGHVIICGAEGSFVNFVEQLRRCDPMPTPIVVLHPRRPSASWTALKALGPVHYVAGTAETPSSVLLMSDELNNMLCQISCLQAANAMLSRVC